MVRFRSRSLPRIALALTAACSSSSSTSSSEPPDSPPPTQQPGDSRAQPASERAAVKLGVTVDARDERGIPRLIRAVVPRATSKTNMTAVEAARDHLAALTPLYLQRQTPADAPVFSAQRLRNGASLVTFEQKVDGIPVHQASLRVMVHKDGSLSAVSGTMIAGSGRTTFKSTPIAAVERALDDAFGKTRARPAITLGADKGDFQELIVAPDAKLKVSTAHAKRELLMKNNQLIPVWTVELFAQEKSNIDSDMAHTAKGLRYLISDVTGSVERKVDLIQNDAFVYRAFADTTGNRNPFDGALKSFNPHPTGTPDGSVPVLDAYNLVVQDSFNGPRDPWLPANATNASGNNIDAFADINPPQGFSAGDIRAEVRAGRTLNYRYDFNAQPLATPTQSKAAVVNVFFITNWLHDWYYDSGFTEATGNAQLDNYGRGGVPGDRIEVHAQSNANGGSRDNANMFTPSDGLQPIMNMFLWTGGTIKSLTGPTGTPDTGVFVAGPSTFELTGEVALATDSAGTHTACTAVGSSVAGKIALIDFDGTCGSITAVANVAAAGAIGVIATISVPGAPTQDLNGNAEANIPGLVIGFDDGVALKAALPATVTLSRATKLENDGDFDNAIVAHEWGHYMHLRLASCEVTNQCFAMSEGWADFNALMMMLRPEDRREGTYGAGLYALTAGGLEAFGFTDPGYFGIRRFPYSLDRTKNANTFKHIGSDNALPDLPNNPGPTSNGNSEVHNAGEIWAQMLWEVYNVLIDDHGLTEAHRRMTDYIVAGLLLTPPEATYTEARDALLAGAGTLDTDDMILMAAAFAGRGAGTCAVGPDRGSTSFAGVVESGTIAARIETSGVSLTDDGVSCDHDGILDQGESGTLHITLSNSGILAAEGVTVTATTTATGVTLGRAVTVGAIQPFSNVDLQIPVRVAATAPANQALNIAITVKGDAGCNTSNLVVNLRQKLGVDEAAAVATSDDLETSIVAWTPTGEGAGDLWGRAEDLDGNHVLFGIDAPFSSDTQLVSPVLQASPTAPLVITLKHAFNLEAFDIFGLFFDGGVLEVSNDGGSTWRDVTEVGVDPGYPAVISTDFDNPLAGQEAFSGFNASFPETDALTLNFGTQFAGQSVQLRFRIGTDFCCTGEGWLIDDIAVSGITNTPFPGFVPEPTRCVNGTPGVVAREADDSSVVEVRSMKRASLTGVPLEATSKL